ncbi:MAG: phosphoglycolate phosphatase [Gemmobacter sp.]
MTMVLFDLDGTLVDSAPDLRAAANRMLADEGAAPIDLATTISFVGNGVPVLVERIIAARGLARPHGELVANFLRHYEADAATLTRPYPGVPQMLETLRDAGHRLGICTNKPEAPARDILRLLGLDGYFPVVVGGDSLPRKKPDPAPLFHAARLMGGGPVAYVGDSEIDAEAAGAAAFPFALFTGGYRKSPVAALAHDAAFADFADLPGLIPGLLAGRG